MGWVRSVLLFLLLACAGAAAGQRAGTGQGYYLDDDQRRIALSHATAVWLDGAETGAPPSVRIALTDRPVGAAQLEGVRDPEILRLGERGEVRGLLLRFDAENPEYVYVDVLKRAEEGGWRLTDQAVIASETLTIGQVGRKRAAAAFEANTWLTAALRFDASVTYDPIVRRLEGEEARQSELVGIAERRFEAELSGDMAALSAVSTRSSARQFAASLRGGGEAFVALMRDQAPALRERLRNPRMAVFRSRTATLAYEEDVREFVLEDGAWKAD